MGIRYNPALDGLRAVAVLLVVALHCHVPGFTGGAVGVDVFFVLSGYLITSILVAEHDRTGRIELRAFYWRRARRLYPALLLMLAAYLAAAPMIWPAQPHVRDALLAGLYLSDYTQSFAGFPVHLGHTWSLSAEEHFYLLWPIALLWLLRDRANLVPRLALLVVLAWAWRWLNHADGFVVGYRFDTRAVGILAGCLLAVLPKIPASRIAAWSGVALLAWLTVNGGGWNLMPLAEIAGVLLVVGASALPLRSPPLVYLGKLSYGIYLWHFPISEALFAHGDWPFVMGWTLPLSIGLAAASHHLWESRFRSENRVFDVAARQ